jgi:glycosyltransferase involved in cell wall biosynthesis
MSLTTATSGCSNAVAEHEEITGISVVVPMRNERAHIRECLNSLLNQTYNQNAYEIIVVDGGSSDGSSEIVRSMQASHPNLFVIDNPARITPISMNLGIREAKKDVIVIAGAHAIYCSDFLTNCAKKLQETGADVVGGPVQTVPRNESFGARLTAAILSSHFGVGNSNFRTSLKEGYVDTVPFGAYRIDVLNKVGLFNEKLVRNQDNDLSARIRQAGGRIYSSPEISAIYFPASSFGELLRQTYKKAQWHFFTMRENVGALGLRHLAPALFLLALACLVVLATSQYWARVACTFTVLAYFVVGFVYSLGSSRQKSLGVALCLPAACFIFHCAYGLGTLVGTRYLVTATTEQTP